MSVPRYLVDTNVLLRFLLHDHQEHAAEADALFRAAQEGRCVLIVNELLLAEAVWVLGSFYKQDRHRVATALGRLLRMPGIRCSRADIVLDAIDRFGSTGVDFVDCSMAAVAAESGETIVSFDGDFSKFEDVRALRPGAAAGT